ncbi:MAG: hypothetical protein OXM02_06970 [Bacteroidota bacterium]|nr:hypothetical protein [Bacteroidota bacterium]
MSGKLQILFRIEVLKTRSRVAFWVILLLAVALNTIFTVISVRTAQFPDRTFALPDSWPQILGFHEGGGIFLVPVLMILLCAPEYTWRTGRQMVINGLSRDQAYGGKVLLLGVLTGLFLLIPILIGGIGALVSGDDSGPQFVRLADLAYCAGLTAALLQGGGMGLMIATLVRSAGPALGILFMYMILEEIIAVLLRLSDTVLRHLAEYLPMHVSEELRDDLAWYPDLLESVNADLISEGAAPYAFRPVEELVLIALIYVVVFVGVGWLSQRHRDL